MRNFTEFLLMGFSDDPVLQKVYAMLFSLIYLAALTGNLLIMVLTTTDQHLQTPLYFFLKNLSFIDICYISVTLPNSIMNSLINAYSISFLGCALQVFFLIVLGGTEYALLLVMSYDRYAAIRHPLHYEAVMNRDTCVQMATYSWVSGGFNAVLHTAATFSVPMCGPLEVHQFFCDIPQLLSLACFSNVRELVVIGLSLLLDLGCFVFIDVSYFHIFSTVLKMPSREGRSKAFSTCLPHLVVVTLFLSSGFFAYLHPLPESPTSFDLLVSVFYTVVPPTVNPLIYSLRNKDMQKALRRLQLSWCRPAR
ncbi:olfactory receptor 14A16 [Heterocephalus glaber]|uniref:Olfactory receptor n=1 Tax=Heterocephalus glaber TaxID=10181 RepID=A0AAX6P285_HETGA|nr:olfactory receptor 14A16 [Heterocephalus glaber]